MEHLISSEGSTPPRCSGCGSTEGFKPHRHFSYVGEDMAEEAWLVCETCGRETSLGELA